LRELSIQRFEAVGKRQIGTQKKVLVLRKAAKGGRSLSRDYWNVEIVGADDFISQWSGQEVDVKILKYDHSNKNRLEGHLIGEILT
jgi:threonylcarbamoyladenosine tRNA methylthiotransferase MtaB